MLAILTSMVLMATQWDFSAKIVPLVVGGVGITVCVLSLFNDMCRKPAACTHPKAWRMRPSTRSSRRSTWIWRPTPSICRSVIVKRAARFFGYLIAFMGVMAVIGLVPTVGALRRHLHAV